jgi:tetratricopeptide (TPR) repeat protein
MLAADPKSYDAIRLRIEIETHRHNFPKAAELAQELTERNPSDTGSLGMLGDSLMEEGQYDAAGKVYRHMLELSPNLTSYNRVAYHDFVTGNSGQALSWMNLAVQAGSPIPENLAWCLVEFGDMLLRPGTPRKRTRFTIAPSKRCPAIIAPMPRSADSMPLPASISAPPRISRRRRT